MKNIKSIKEWIVNAPEYEIKRSNVLVHLHLNEFPYDLPQTLKREIFNRLERMPWNYYPEWRNKRIHQYFAESLNLSEKNVAICKGMTLLLRSIFDLLVNPFGSILLMNQEYEYLDTLTQMFQVEATKLEFERNFIFPVDRIVEELKLNSYDLVYFSNPNNPTGAILDVFQLSKILEIAECPVILDECYVSFSEQNMQQLLAKFPNLIIIRSLALEYGVASARLGYALAEEKVISGLKKVLSPFLLGVFSEVLITVLLEYKSQLFLRTKRVKQIREFVLKRLQKYEFLTVYPSSANFLLIQFPFNADEVKNWYLEKEILVKSLNHYSGLDQMIRVSISDEKSMKLFLDATKVIINEKMKDFI